jgi:aquaporin Z
MTTAPHWLDDADSAVAAVEKRHKCIQYAVEALGTFGLVVTVGVGLCSGSPFAALGIGAVLMALIYAGGYRTGANFNPAITVAAVVWGRIPFREAAVCWLVQLAAGLCAAIATRLIVGSGQSASVMQMMLGGRVLVAAFGAELLLTFILGYVVFSCVEPASDAPNTVWELALGVALVAGTVDFAALFGAVFLVSQVVAGAFTGIAFLTFGSALA